MKLIGITGPSGAGKTTALSALESLGAEVVDADRVYHRLLAEDGELRKALVSAFGKGILGPDGRVDRRALSQAVYPDRLRELEGLTHPAILRRIAQLRRDAQAQGRTALAVDASGLIESGLAGECDVVIAVLAPVEVRVARIMARDGIEEGYARRRIEAQPDDGFYRSHSDAVLENTGEDAPEAFARYAREFFREILETP